MARDAQLDRLSYYTLLGVDNDTTTADIKKAFRGFARRYHPDRFAAAPKEKRERATRIYRRGAEGLQVLVDPAARKLYDLALTKGITRLTAEQRDNAGRPRPKKKAKRPITSTEALHWFDRARALEKSDLAGAWRLMQRAQKVEPTSALISDELSRLAASIRRGG